MPTHYNYVHMILFVIFILKLQYNTHKKTKKHLTSLLVFLILNFSFFYYLNVVWWIKKWYNSSGAKRTLLFSYLMFHTLFGDYKFIPPPSLLQHTILIPSFISIPFFLPKPLFPSQSLKKTEHYFSIFHLTLKFETS